MGFTYLYVGFTHVPKDQTYFSAMIRDLEKRPGNARILQPFYEYGKETFQFEKKKSWQKKVEEAEIPKGLNEEDKKIIEEAGGDIKDVEIDESKLSKEEKIEFYLEDAKKEGGGVEEEEGVLEMD